MPEPWPNARVGTAVQVVLILFLILALSWGPAPAVSFDPAQLVDYASNRYGPKAGRATQAWQDMLAQAAGLDESEQLQRVNAFWNQTLIGDEDINIWGQVDYWATPLESLAKGAGDCEDFVIAKYFSLLYLGVAPEKLRLVYVRAQIGSQSIAHMVLGYYPEPQAQPLVLDNLIDRIQPAGRRPDLTPVFSFNGQGVYIPGGRQSSIDSVGRWRGLLARMRAEGIQP